MSRNAIVYASRARTTGALAITIDTRHPDVKDGKLPFKGVMVDGKFPEFADLRTIELRKRTKAEEQMRYAAYDVDHKVTAYFADHYPAGRAIAWPQEWCKKCEALFEKGTNIRPTKAKAATPTPITAAKSAKAPAKAKAPEKAPGNKRTSSKAENDAKRRQAAEVAKPSEVVTRTPEVTNVGPTEEHQPASPEELEKLAAAVNSNS